MRGQIMRNALVANLAGGTVGLVAGGLAGVAAYDIGQAAERDQVSGISTAGIGVVGIVSLLSGPSHRSFPLAIAQMSIGAGLIGGSVAGAF